MTHLGSLSDEELIARTRISMTAGSMERELARRLADALDQIEGLTAEAALLEDKINDLELEVRRLDS
jgi:Uri superfamily endonuclease